MPAYARWACLHQGRVADLLWWWWAEAGDEDKFFVAFGAFTIGLIVGALVGLWVTL